MIIIRERFPHSLVHFPVLGKNVYFQRLNKSRVSCSLECVDADRILSQEEENAGDLISSLSIGLARNRNHLRVFFLSLSAMTAI